MLRVPAAGFTAVLVLVMVAGDLVLSDPDANSRLFEYAVVIAWALPFLMPWPRTATRPASLVLFAWTALSAALATGRAGYLATWFFPRRPFGIWAGLSFAFLTFSASLWVAAWAAWRRVISSRSA